MLGFPVIGHVSWAICLDSVARPTSRFPNPGNVVAGSRARVLARFRRIGYLPAPAIEQYGARVGSSLLLLRCSRVITRSFLGTGKQCEGQRCKSDHCGLKAIYHFWESLPQATFELPIRPGVAPSLAYTASPSDMQPRLAKASISAMACAEGRCGGRFSERSTPERALFHKREKDGNKN